jgi:hypothetical protein
MMCPFFCRQPHQHHSGHGLQAELPAVQQVDGPANHRCVCMQQLLCMHGLDEGHSQHELRLVSALDAERDFAPLQLQQEPAGQPC